MMKDLIKDASTNINVELLKNEFVKQYAVKKGWNTESLTAEQMNEIQDQEEYKSFIIKG